MKIVIDEKIPYLKDALQKMGYDVVAKPGIDIDSSDVADADALFVHGDRFCAE